MSVPGVPPAVTQFLAVFLPLLSGPQFAHLAWLVTGLICHEGGKSLWRISRLFPGPSSRSAASDFLTSSPWDSAAVMAVLRETMFRAAFKALGRLPKKGRRPVVFVRIDDTLVEKSKDAHGFRGADYHFDHTTGRMVLGLVFVTLSVSAGPFTFSPAFRMYLRSRTVRRLRRQSARNEPVYGLSGEKHNYVSKLGLARELLLEIAPHMEKEGLSIYVLFDSWYSSQALIRFCRGRGWHVICAIKSNRKVGRRPIQAIARTLAKREFVTVEVASSRGEKTAYHVASVCGRVKGVPDCCRVLISLRKKRDKSPFYLLSTDTTLPLPQVMQHYQGRWLVELLHWNLKVKLGFGDFRVRSLRGICRYAAICLVAQCLLERRAWQTPGTPPVNAISDVRRERAAGLLRPALRRARKGVQTGTILKTLMPLLT